MCDARGRKLPRFREVSDPLSTLRRWEQGAKQPDQAARAYLRAIAGDPVGVQRALHAPVRQPE